MIRKRFGPLNLIVSFGTARSWMMNGALVLVFCALVAFGAPIMSGLLRACQQRGHSLAWCIFNA